jgi:hypothetical protein
VQVIIMKICRLLYHTHGRVSGRRWPAMLADALIGRLEPGAEVVTPGSEAVLPRTVSKDHEREFLKQQLRRQLTGVGCRVVLRGDLDYIRSRNVQAV